MKLIVNQLNGLTGFKAANFKLINFVLAASLFISTPTYALDAEGWGTIIKGVSEVLQENQQQEIKQREEQQRLEQQRLQEQQAQQLRQQNLQLANNVASGQNCGHKIGQDALKKWTGGCLNGYLFGEGELILFIDQAQELRKYIGKFNDGYFSGVALVQKLEKNGVVIPIYLRTLSYYENDKMIVIPVAVEINNRLQSYAYKNFDWYKTTSDGKEIGTKISFEEAMQIVKNFMATKNSDTMSYERFRAYLEGKLIFDPSQAVAQQTSSSPSAETVNEATDEPPQKGIFLDRRKKATTKKRK